MSEAGHLDEGFFRRYRELLDAEDAAFDELEHAYEEGDRALSYDNCANSYLVKPVSFEGFVDVVRQIEDYWFTINVGPPGMAYEQ